jgi:hypothetical protein
LYADEQATGAFVQERTSNRIATSTLILILEHVPFRRSSLGDLVRYRRH